MMEVEPTVSSHRKWPKRQHNMSLALHMSVTYNHVFNARVWNCRTDYFQKVAPYDRATEVAETDGGISFAVDSTGRYYLMLT